VSSTDLNGKPQVLVVDDDASMRNLLRSFLSDRGYQAVTVGDAEEAVRRYQNERPAAVILDMVMPLLDGKSAFHALRRINPRVRIILASGYSIDGEAQTLMDEGATAFLQKPFRLATLAEALACAAPASDLSTPIAS